MSMKKFSRRFLLIAVVAVALVYPGVAGADVANLSIRQIQETADPAGNSPYNSSSVDCAGGIVIGKLASGQPRIQLYDPADPNGWGGIQVKDWSVGAALFNGVSPGDWVSFADIPVEDYRGTTLLQYDPLLTPAVSFTIESSGNSLPAPLLISASQIAAPTETSPDFWMVANHSAEKYESMLLKIEDITVTQMDLGKASDNYNLQTTGADVWASDYLNVNRVGYYDPKVSIGQHFASVSGMLEQYTRTSSTYGWDYYQLLTRSTADLVIPEPGSLLLLSCGLAWLFSRKSR